MRSIALLSALAVFAAAPLAAQGNFRTGGIDPPRRTTPNSGSVLGDILGRDTARVRTQSKKSGHIPPGQLPPPGMCRVWIDGVPPGQQPAPTDCQTAVATKPANARVIFGGDGTSFPGKGKGKFDKQNRNRQHDEDDDRDDDDEAHGHASRSGILGSVIPGSTQQKSIAAGKGKKGKGRG
jgi:hypothetical protein